MAEKKYVTDKELEELAKPLLVVEVVPKWEPVFEPVWLYIEEHLPLEDPTKI